MEFKFDVQNWYKDLAYDIEDGWNDMWDNIDLGTDQMIDSLNMEGAGEDVGSSFMEGMSGSIERASNLSEAIRKQSEEAKEAAIDGMVNFDPSEVDTAWADTTGHWLRKANDMAKGVGNAIVGAFGGAVNEAANDPSLGQSIGDYFGNVWAIFKNKVDTFIMDMIQKGREIGEGLKTLWLQITDPEEARKAEQRRTQRIMSDRAVEMTKRMKDFEQRETKQLEIMRAREAKNKRQLEQMVNLTGLGVAGEGKGEKKLAKEKRIRNTQLAASMDKISAATRKYAEAQAEVTKLAGMKDADPGDIALAEARSDMAKAGMDETMKTMTKQAKKWGMSKEQITGLVKAMELVRDQTIQEISDESKLEEIRGRVTEQAQTLSDFMSQSGQMMDEKSKAMADSALQSGYDIMYSEQQGMLEGVPMLMDASTQAADAIGSNLIANSPIEEGPLAGTKPYDSGFYIMEQFAYGIASSTDMVRESVEQVLTDSVLIAMEEYGKKVEELSKKKSMLASLAKTMVRDFAGSLDLGTVKVEGEGDLSAKQTFEAALNVPGLAGVIAAIASDGHKTRVLLKKIYDDTHAIAQSDLVKNTKTNSAGQLAVLPG